MMMLIIFLITDISMVGIFAGVYGNIAKYREGMLMGVHIPKSELEHPNVKELLQLYKKRNRQFYLWNMLAGIAVCLLCFTYFSIFITVWTLWFVEFCLLTILRVYHYHQKVYDIKQKNGWISSANADVSAAVDTRTSSQIAKKILPAKLHLIPAAVILIPSVFPAGPYLSTDRSDGRVMLLCTILVAAAYMVPAIYSPICQTKFTVKIHRSTCRSMHWKSVYTPYSFLSPTFAIPAPISGSSGILHPATGLAELEWASTFSSN